MVGTRSRWIPFLALTASLVSTAARASDPWANTGPTGAIVNALAIDSQHPGTLYAGTKQGGVYKTTNGGASWQAVNQGVTSLWILSLAVDPTNSATVYAGTMADSGSDGLFKSTDGGASWNPITPLYLGTSPSPVYSIVIDPSSPSTLYAGSGGVIFKSTDGGGSWTTIQDFSAAVIVVLAMDPTNSSVLYAAGPGCAPGALYKSTDAGATWQQLEDFPSTGAQAIVVDPVDPNVVYTADYGCAGTGVSKSTDGGMTWSAPASGPLGAAFALVMDPSNHNTLYTGVQYGTGYAGVYKSTDGGENWGLETASVSAYFSVSALAVDPSSPSTVYAGGWDYGQVSSGGVIKSADGGQSWNAVDAGFLNTFVKGVKADPSNPSIIYAGLTGDGRNTSGVGRSTDGGQTWTLTELFDPLTDVAAQVYDFSIDPTNPSTVWAAAGVVYKSTDHGSTWQVLNNDVSPYVGITTVAADPFTPTTAYAGSANGYGLLKTVNGGNDWVATAFPNAYVSGLAVDPNSGTVFAISGGVWRSRDGGDTWDGPLGCGALGPVAIASDSTVIYAACYYPTAGISKSLDGGDTWVPADSGIDTLFVTSIAVDPAHPSIVYAGTDQNNYYTGAVYRSVDAGDHWDLYGTGLEPNFVYGLAVSAAGKLYAGTDGTGIFRIDTCVPVDPPAASGTGAVCSGQTIQLNAPTITGATYRWTGPNGFTSNVQNPSIPSATIDASGTYKVYATVASCETAPGTLDVTVNQTPTAQASGGGEIIAGGSGTQIQGYGGATCAWLPATGLDNPSSCFPNANPASTTLYSLTVTSAEGCSSTNTATVLVTVIQNDVTPPTVTVTQPNGGERAFTGSPYVIQWTASDDIGVVSVDVAASSDGGSTYNPIAGCTGLAGTATSCAWAAPGPTTTNGRVRVTAHDAAGNAGLDASNANFSILSGAASVTVTAPNTAVTWRIGDATRQIKFNHTLGKTQKVAIDLSTDGGTTWSSINPAFSTNAATTGTYTWPSVAGPTTTQGWIRVTWSGSPTVTDSSDVNFKIIDRVTVTAPNTAVSWTVGTSHAITWTTNLGASDTVDIDASADSGATWMPIVAGVPATAGTYGWLVSGPSTAHARIRISWSANPVRNDVSDTDFTIADALIHNLSPNGGQAWRIGDSRNVTFSHNLGTGQTIDVEISRDGGSTYSSLGSFVTTSAGSGKFPWTVTGPTTSQARVRVSWAANASVQAASAANFTVNDRITVTAPNTAVTWTIGSSRSIKFTHNLGAGQLVNLAVSRDGGSTWSPIATSTTTGTSETVGWSVTGPATTSARIRVSWASDPSVNDVSDVNFKIQ